MKTILAVLLASAAMLATPAQAVDGNELYQWGREWKRSDTQNARDAGSFTGYIQGFIDLHTDLSDPEIGIIKAKFFCVPARTQRGQAFDAVMRYLEAHPEKHRFTASSLVASGLWEAFPCD
ncbi:MAG: hypothetical protein JSW48_15415 [Betaproteobacteria bacterium]|jgi:hypothetical protein|nr:MAG: hypothetical protein JSW48_15415 [Betaproteobacteria bacterium]